MERRQVPIYVGAILAGLLVGLVAPGSRAGLEAAINLVLLEAALKYYLMGTLSGVTMLVGVTLLFSVGGSTQCTDLAFVLSDAPRVVVAVGLVAVLAGLLFKIGAVPLHFWVPDVVQGATTPVAAFVATIPMIGGLWALYRLLIAVIAAVTMMLGNLAAFFQDGVRRLLAYSTISQVGCLLMAVAAANRAALALPALGLYLAAYAVTNLGAFVVVTQLPRAITLADYRAWPPGTAGWH